MFKKIRSFFHAERSIVLHQDQIQQHLNEKQKNNIPTPAEQMLAEEETNKEFFEAHPLARGFGMK